jgi:hypothetical protein
MGVHVDLSVTKPGYFPDVVGEVIATVKSLKSGENLKAIQILDKKGPVRIEVYVNTSCSESLTYFHEKFEPSLKHHLEETLASTGATLNFQPHETFEPIKGKAKTLAVSAIIKYDSLTLLHASVLIDGVSQLHNN